MKKIANTVLVLILVVFMALMGFVYYAWVVKKRSRSAAENIIQTNLLIDKVRHVAMLDNNYTSSIRDMLMMDQVTIPAASHALPDSMLHLLKSVAASMPGDTVSQKILDNFSILLQKKSTTTSVSLPWLPPGRSRPGNWLLHLKTPCSATV